MAAGDTYPIEITTSDGTIVKQAGEIVYTDAANQPASVTDDTVVWVTVVAAPPSSFVSPLMFDSTASTGGLYAWDGTQYQKVGLATS